MTAHAPTTPIASPVASPGAGPVVTAPGEPAPGVAIRCLGLTKDYGGGHGVFDLDLAVGIGEVFGFIGTNGAGKTTTIRLLMDLIRADRGQAEILGLDTRWDSLAVKRIVGYLPGELPSFPGVSAGDVIGLLAGLRGGVPEERIAELARRLDLDLARRYEDLSHGNKQKVGLVQAFMHRPRVTILDEPTLGLDPLIQNEFRALVRERVDDGGTVFLSTHVLSDAEELCDRIGILRAGRLHRVGTLADLRDLRAHRVQAVLTGRLTAADLTGLPGVSAPVLTSDPLHHPFQQHLECTVTGSVEPLLTLLVAAGVIELDSRELSLEEVFLRDLSDPHG